MSSEHHFLDWIFLKLLNEDSLTKQSEEKLRFKHYALVKAKHRAKGWVIGSVRSLKAKIMTLRTKRDYNFPVSYRKSRFLRRFARIIYYLNRKEGEKPGF